jgi:NAD(P)-dependent dehydrogenase (short-subunit alcohol dehydrogenase family)
MQANKRNQTKEKEYGKTRRQSRSNNRGNLWISIGNRQTFCGRRCIYNATKAAVRSFARTWTVDLKSRKIRVNVLSPGTIDTGVFVGVPKEVKDQFVSLIPMGRIGQPHEIATAALFLASDDSSFITGIELFVDGGTAQT